jgi:3-deoxy-manno-octulosonate cytidylyltransferase (CMP-KDO synthetase)
VAEVVTRRDFARYDVILNVQGDEPFVPAAALRAAVDLVARRGFPLGTVACHATPEILAMPHVVKVVCADDGRAMYFSRAPIPFPRDGAEGAPLDGVVRQHVGVYAYTPEALARWVALPPHPLECIERLEQLRPLAAGMPMGVATIDEPPPGGIDTEEDLERANERWPQFTARHP